MSRVNVKGLKFDVSFGVDHVTGVFLQIWGKPMSEQDGAFLKIDGKVLTVDEESDGFKEFPKPAMNYIKDCVSRMQKGQGHYLGPEHICNILAVTDEFEDVKALRASVYATLD